MPISLDFDDALVGGDGGAGGTQWDKLMQESLNDPEPTDALNDEEEECECESECECVLEDEEDSDLSSVPSDKFVYQESNDDSTEQSEEAEEEDRTDRRYLIDTHSFMHLKDPGLADALILKGIWGLLQCVTYRAL